MGSEEKVFVDLKQCESCHDPHTPGSFCASCLAAGELLEPDPAHPMKRKASSDLPGQGQAKRQNAQQGEQKVDVAMAYLRKVGEMVSK